MAVNIRRFPVLFSQKAYRQDSVGFRNFSAKCGVDNLQEFQNWHNGGGIFHQSACIDSTALVEVGAIVHSNAVLGANVCIGSGTVVGPAVTIGQSTKTGYNVALNNCIIGDSCIVHNGVCIGQDGAMFHTGFGFFVDEQGIMLKKPQMLNVKIGNHVEIGANTCIDRGSWRDTVIGDHSKIDNLVQIGHNVIIGKSCMLCGQTGIAGSVTIGDYVTLGGRVAVRDHVSIASKLWALFVGARAKLFIPQLFEVEVRLAANSCVTKNITEPGDYGGFPAVPIREWRRQVANQCRISKKGIP